MNSQKIVVVNSTGLYEVATQIVDDPIIEPKGTKIRVRNHYAGVNGLFDHMLMQGKVNYLSLRPPFDLGIEAIGIIEAVGEDAHLDIGDAIATTGLGGAYRHRHIVDAQSVYRIPSANPEYLAIVPTGISAFLALEHVANAKRGETVLITAAAGGFGHICVQLAVNKGCRVIGIAGGPAKCAFVEGLGAEICLNYKTEDVEQILSTQFTDAIDVGIDTVGGPLFDAILKNVAPLGRIVSAGFASEIVKGAKPVQQPRIYDSLYWKGASVRGFMNALLADYHQDAAQKLFSMMATDTLKVSIDSTEFKGLASLPEAAGHMMSGKNIGKTVLDLR